MIFSFVFACFSFFFEGGDEWWRKLGTDFELIALENQLWWCWFFFLSVSPSSNSKIMPMNFLLFTCPLPFYVSLFLTGKGLDTVPDQCWSLKEHFYLKILRPVFLYFKGRRVTGVREHFLMRIFLHKLWLPDCFPTNTGTLTNATWMVFHKV